MKSFMLAGLLFILGTPAYACSMTPLGASLTYIEAVTSHLSKFDDDGAVEVQSISTAGSTVRAEIIFELFAEKEGTYCSAYEYDVNIEADCSTTIASEVGPLACD